MADVHVVALPGCRVEPLLSYLKALGVLRLVAQKDAGARGWWEGDAFHLQSSLDWDALVGFFLREYQPTPVMAPWNKAGGFFEDGREELQAIAGSRNPRLAGYARAIAAAQQVLQQMGLKGKKDLDDNKAELLRALRREMPDDVVAWLDSCLVLTSAEARYPPLLGSGGGDGRLDFTRTFLRHCATVVDAGEGSRDWLLAALFEGLPERLARGSPGMYGPAGVGGPNATAGFEGDGIVNPWDFVLAIEGAMLFAGAAARRLGSMQEATSFPFTVDVASAGCTTLSDADGAGGAEIWLPMWHRPAPLPELQAILGEGRAQLGRRQARNGVEFARAVAQLGVDRGIRRFQRYGLLKKRVGGENYRSAVPLGSFDVREEPLARLVDEADAWLAALRRRSRDGGPARFASALRAVDDAVFELCLRGGPARAQRVLAALGAAEAAVARGAKPGDLVGWPLQTLSPRWIDACDDGTPEYRLAASLASLHRDREGALRVNLEPVAWEKGRFVWTELGRSVVWSEADLARNLKRILHRRLLDATGTGEGGSPLQARVTAPLADVDRFLHGEVDGRRVSQLLQGFATLKWHEAPHRAFAGPLPLLLPRSYALLKLLFLPSKVPWGGEEVAVPPSREVLALLERGNTRRACEVAVRVLEGKGLLPLADGGDFAAGTTDARRMAAALLIPISNEDARWLASLVLRLPAKEREPMTVEAE